MSFLKVESSSSDFVRVSIVKSSLKVEISDNKIGDYINPEENSGKTI